MKPPEEGKEKFGAGHASAMWRQGLGELRAAFYPESNVAQPTEYGIYGTKTPQEIVEDKRPGEGEPNDDARPSLADRLKQMDAGRDEKESPERAEREIERDYAMSTFVAAYWTTFGALTAA